MFLCPSVKIFFYIFFSYLVCFLSHKLGGSVNYLTSLCFEQEIMEGSFIIARDNSWEVHGKFIQLPHFFSRLKILVLLFLCIFTVFVLILRRH